MRVSGYKQYDKRKKEFIRELKNTCKNKEKQAKS